MATQRPLSVFLAASLSTLSVNRSLWLRWYSLFCRQPRPAMGYLDDIEFLESEEAEGREAAIHNAEKDTGVLLGLTVPVIDHPLSRSASPSIYNFSQSDPRAPTDSVFDSASSLSINTSASTPFNGLYEWTMSQKRDLAAHAEDVCREMDVPADEQRTFIENAQVST